jgi:hypothetical protein
MITPVFIASDAQLKTADTVEWVPVFMEIPTAEDALAVVSTIDVTVDGVTMAQADGWTMEVEEREIGGVTILALLSVTVAGALITESGAAVAVYYKVLTEV